MQYPHFLNIIITLMLQMTSTYAQRPHHDSQIKPRDFPHRLQVCEPEKIQKRRLSLIIVLFCFTQVLPLIFTIIQVTFTHQYSGIYDMLLQPNCGCDVKCSFLSLSIFIQSVTTTLIFLEVNQMI